MERDIVRRLCHPRGYPNDRPCPLHASPPLYLSLSLARARFSVLFVAPTLWAFAFLRRHSRPFAVDRSFSVRRFSYPLFLPSPSCPPRSVLSLFLFLARFLVDCTRLCSLASSRFLPFWLSPSRSLHGTLPLSPTCVAAVALSLSCTRRHRTTLPSYLLSLPRSHHSHVSTRCELAVRRRLFNGSDGFTAPERAAGVTFPSTEISVRHAWRFITTCVRA